MEPKAQEVATAAEWKAKKTTMILTLPSGVEIEVKERRAFALVLANILPLDLVQAVIKANPEPGAEKEETNGASSVSSLDTLKKVIPLLIEIVVSPRIVLIGPAESGEIAFGDIPDDDLTVLISYLMGKEVSEKLKPFRRVRNGSPD